MVHDWSHAVKIPPPSTFSAWNNFCPMRRFGGWADPESYVVMKRKTCFFPGWVGCINILMVSQFYPHFPARLRLHRGACPQSMREWLCCPHAGCNILDRYKVVPVDHKSLSKPVLFLVPSPTVNFCKSMEVCMEAGILGPLAFCARVVRNSCPCVRNPRNN